MASKRIRKPTDRFIKYKQLGEEDRDRKSHLPPAAVGYTAQGIKVSDGKVMIQSSQQVWSRPDSPPAKLDSDKFGNSAMDQT